mmetsp:Transcript_1728/g.3676  ORF Transcript_1728/g.3676 Transcript_1728/m.3676 type:complete len:262 (-) Transcript_1728:1346-2131(-)
MNGSSNRQETSGGNRDDEGRQPIVVYYPIRTAPDSSCCGKCMVGWAAVSIVLNIVILILIGVSWSIDLPNLGEESGDGYGDYDYDTRDSGYDYDYGDTDSNSGGFNMSKACWDAKEDILEEHPQIGAYQDDIWEAWDACEWCDIDGKKDHRFNSLVDICNSIPGATPYVKSLYMDCSAGPFLQAKLTNVFECLPQYCSTSEDYQKYNQQQARDYEAYLRYEGFDCNVDYDSVPLGSGGVVNSANLLVVATVVVSIFAGLVV